MFLNRFVIIFCLSVVCIQFGKSQIKKDSFPLSKIDGTLVPSITIIEVPYQSGDLIMTQDQFKSMPASFQDPARILIKYPGFSTPNDGANAIIYRGMPPETTKWQLFDADIINPNHLSNAGTANDQATSNAGGVNALSGSVLGRYHFESNPADVSYSNLLSGVSNMNLAPKINSFVDLNLIGLEAGIGTNRNNKNYFLSYRYSFVGLLNTLGVDFGGEKIGYQDATGYADLISKTNKHLKIFGTLGASSNVFTSVPVGDSISRFKDIQNITYKSRVGMGGLNFYQHWVGKDFRSTLAFSSRSDQRDESTNPFYADSLHMSLNQHHLLTQSLLSSHSSLNINSFNDRFTFGLRMNVNSDSRTKQTYHLQSVFSLYPYINYNRRIGQNFSYDVGIGSLYDTNSSEITAEPSLSAAYYITGTWKMKFDYRLSSIQNYASLDNVVSSFPSKRMKSHNLQWSAYYEMEKMNANLSVFYHQMWDVGNFAPMGSQDVGHFSLFNGANLGYDQMLGSISFRDAGMAKARSYGVEYLFENTSKFSSKQQVTYSINGSFFNSQYSLPSVPNVYYDARYNFKYTNNINLNYNISLNGNSKLSFGLTNHLRGGQREQPIVSDVNKFPYFIQNSQSSYVNSLKAYQRVDFRVVYFSKKDGRKTSRRWSLDIQNLFNYQNDGFKYYDPLYNSVLLQKQLGLIPVVSYRIEWL